MKLPSFLRKAIGDYRNNSAAAFIHGVRILTTFIFVAIAGLSVLTYLGVIQPTQLIVGIGYAAILLVADYAIVSDLALGLRFVAPELFGFLTLSTLVNLITALGAVSIALRWRRAS